jgi:Domain of Unknown Function (DUF1080)
MNHLAWCGVLGVLLAYCPAIVAMDKVIAPDLSKVKDAKTWSTINAEFEATTEDGKSVVHLKPKGMATTGSVIGIALVEGLEFAEGEIEVDLKGKGKLEASFVGVAFNVADGKNFETVYFRPFNFMSEDETRRAHAVQYIAWPEHTWEKLRNGKPGVYEAAVKPVPDPEGWFHARIQVGKQRVSVWVDDGKEPCLVVDRLASPRKGKVGLWVDSKEGKFRNLKISSAD